MTKYRKKPLEIEAFQMTKARRWDNSEWPHWLNLAWNRHPRDGSALWCSTNPNDNEQLFLSTLEGSTYKISWGDWIIQDDIKGGELYPCKPDIFKRAYDLVIE